VYGTLTKLNSQSEQTFLILFDTSLDITDNLTRLQMWSSEHRNVYYQIHIRSHLFIVGYLWHCRIWNCIYFCIHRVFLLRSPLSIAFHLRVRFTWAQIANQKTIHLPVDCLIWNSEKEDKNASTSIEEIVEQRSNCRHLESLILSYFYHAKTPI
jgi:hypothetical protein